jgi:hypothetical protein
VPLSPLATVTTTPFTKAFERGLREALAPQALQSTFWPLTSRARSRPGATAITTVFDPPLSVAVRRLVRAS